jgi:NADH-quinone oxidoreductase subunit J
MDFKTVLFYVFAAIVIFAALRVITDRNPVHSALYLVLTFFSAASIWMLLQAEFLAIVLVLVYVGAVMVLFLFVVMMLDIDIEEMRKGFWKSLWVAIPVGFAIIFELSAVIMRSFWSLDAQAPAAHGNIGGTRELGQVLYTQYTYPFEIAGSILLVAIIAAVALTLRKRKDVKYFAPGDAVKVKAKDRMRIVHMKAESARAGGDVQSAAPSAENK